MYHQMENAFAHVEVDELGAQLHSLRRRKDGYEYLWQGDPAIWPGQAPILFPIVGSLAEERYWLGGQPYQMPRHGFARLSNGCRMESATMALQPARSISSATVS